MARANRSPARRPATPQRAPAPPSPPRSPPKDPPDAPPLSPARRRDAGGRRRAGAAAALPLVGALGSPQAQEQRPALARARPRAGVQRQPDVVRGARRLVHRRGPV